MSQEAWRALAEKALGGSLETVTPEGLRLQPLYSRSTRALPHALRQREGAWAIAQRVDHPDPAEANRLALIDLASGATALTLVFAGPTARGYGLPLTLDALTTALDGVELDLISLRLDAGGSAAEAMRMLSQLTAERRLASARLAIDVGLDPLGSLARVGAIPDLTGPEVRSLREAAGRAGLAGALFLADGRPYHEAAAGEAEELAATIAAGIAYLRLLQKAGSDLGEARADLAFLLAADAEMILTVAKFRALRRLWARVEDACGLDPRPIRIHAETSWRMMTRREPATNIMRAAAAALAAGLGGADAVTVLPFTAALGLPDDAARRLAGNTQVILQAEAHLADVDDPAAGSGGLEAVTEALCEQAWSFFQEIERGGGLEAGLRAGTIQARVAATAARRRHAVATAKRGITGTSIFPALSEPAVRLAAADRAPLVAAGRLALPACRDAEPFEALRDRADAAAAAGARPVVFLAALGTPAQYGGSAAHAANVLAAAGIETVVGAVGLYDASATPLACLCAARDTADADLAEAAAALRQSGARKIMTCDGASSDHERTAGIDVFIHDGCDRLQVLDEALDLLVTGGLEPR